MARKIKYEDGFAFERGLERQGFSHDSMKTYRTNWHGITVEVQRWEKSGRGNPMSMLLLRVGNEFELYKQTDIEPFFDGDVTDAEVIS